MKTCRFCAEEIQDAAIVCKHCGRDLSAVAAPEITKRHTTPSTIVIALLILLGLGWYASSMQRRVSLAPPTVTAAPARAPAPPAPDVARLALVSTRGYPSTSGHYWYVEGEVKNLTGQSLTNVEAAVSWFDKDHAFITADTALLEYNPLLSGQTSPFKVITRGNPLMANYTVGFKQLAGGAIAARDDRTK